MTWLAIQPTRTVTVRVPDEEGAPTFTLGLWPPYVAEIIGARFRQEADRISKGDVIDPTAGISTLEAAVAFSLRGWEGLGPCEMTHVEVPFPGLFEKEKKLLREPRASDGALAILHANKLLVSLAEYAIALNNAKPAAILDGTWKNVVTDGA